MQNSRKGGEQQEHQERQGERPLHARPARRREVIRDDEDAGEGQKTGGLRTDKMPRSRREDYEASGNFAPVPHPSPHPLAPVAGVVLEQEAAQLVQPGVVRPTVVHLGQLADEVLQVGVARDHKR